MYLYVILLLLNFEIMLANHVAKTSDDLSSDLSWRIWGGKDSDVKKYPYMVSITTGKSYTRHHCGGTLINEFWVLTAAHCFYRTVKNKQIRYLHWGKTGCRILIGVTDLRLHDTNPAAIKRKCSKLIDHHKYSTDGFYNFDIAMIKMDEPVKGVEFIKLASAESVNNALENKTTPKCVAVGWGDVGDDTGQHSPILQEAEMDLMDIPNCRNYYSIYVTSLFSNICAIKKGASPCTGDSGGPLICDGEQFALVNFGATCEDKIKEKDGYWPDCLARVDFYEDWIQDTMNYSPNVSFNFTFILLLLYLCMYI